MRITLFHIALLTLALSACAKGKDCEQLYQSVISIENRTGRSLVLEMVDGQNASYTVEMTAFEKADHKLVKEYYKTHEGGTQKGGAPFDGKCTSNPEVIGVSSFLAESSFNKVKHCLDNINYKSLIIEISEACPSNTFEQKSPGLP